MTTGGLDSHSNVSVAFLSGAQHGDRLSERGCDGASFINEKRERMLSESLGVFVLEILGDMCCSLESGDFLVHTKRQDDGSLGSELSVGLQQRLYSRL